MDTGEEVKRLWKLCFDDTDEFIELYFKYKYSESVNRVIRDKGRVISALQALPYSMSFLGRTINTAYISGACTDPAYRGKGVMRELLTLSFARMKQNSEPVSTLIPAEHWLFDYYGRMGYASVFGYAVREIKNPPSFLPTGITVKSTYIYKVEEYEYLSGELMKRACCVQHTATDYKVILADLALAGGSALVAYRQNRVAGIALVVPQKEVLQVKELLADDAEVEKQLLNEAFDLYRPQKIDVISPCSEGDTPRPLGMARVIDAKTILDIYAATYPEEKTVLRLTDNEIPANNGYYHIANGKCTYSDKKMAEYPCEVSAKELTIMVFHSLRPYMSLMLN